MSDMPATPPTGQVPPGASAPETPRGRGRWFKLAVGAGAAAVVAVGATALAQSTTSTTTTHDSDASITASAATSSTTTTVPGGRHGFGFGGRFRGGIGPAAGFGGLGLGGGPVLYGQYTIKGPNGYETLSERTGTVSDVTDTAGSTWSLTVKSADGTSGTFTVDSGTSVNGGEMGIGSVKTGNTVQVTAVVSGATSTAKQVIDQTTLKANAGSWRPMPAPPSPTSGSGTSTGQSGGAPA